MNETDAHRQQADKVRRLFDSVGDEWGTQYGGKATSISQLDLLLRARIVRNMLSCRAPIGGRLRLLDMGCGTGHVLNGVSDTGWNIVGMDFAAGMIQVAAAEHPSRSFLVADARAIPVQPASFDAITIVGVLEYIVEHQRVVGELARVLKPGGMLVISVPNAASLFRKAHTLERAMTRPIRRLLKRRESRYHQFRWKEAALRHMLAEEGFTVEAVEYCTYGLKTPFFDQSPANMQFCAWASSHYRVPSRLSRGLAWTLIAQARSREHR